MSNNFRTSTFLMVASKPRKLPFRIRPSRASRKLALRISRDDVALPGRDRAALQCKKFGVIRDVVRRGDRGDLHRSVERVESRPAARRLMLVGHCVEDRRIVLRRRIRVVRNRVMSPLRSSELRAR